MKITTNYRVVASVDRYTFEKDPLRKAGRFAQKARELEQEIRRHCDGFEQTWVEWDVVCSHCDSTWETEASGEPVCCLKAQEEWAATQSAAGEQS